MSKPTTKIIELAKKLKQLGYRQEIKRSNWAVIKGELFVNPLTQPYPKRQGDIPIPSLEDGLLWLKKRKGHLSLHCSTSEKWVIESSAERESKDNNIWIVGLCVFADTPHEAVLKAMIEIKERIK